MRLVAEVTTAPDEETTAESGDGAAAAAAEAARLAARVSPPPQPASRRTWWATGTATDRPCAGTMEPPRRLSPKSRRRATRPGPSATPRCRKCRRPRSRCLAMRSRCSRRRSCNRHRRRCLCNCKDLTQGR